jgi:molybdopterin-binding protein
MTGISARNQLKGKVVGVVKGQTMPPGEFIDQLGGGFVFDVE